MSKITDIPCDRYIYDPEADSGLRLTECAWKTLDALQHFSPTGRHETTIDHELISAAIGYSEDKTAQAFYELIQAGLLGQEGKHLTCSWWQRQRELNFDSFNDLRTELAQELDLS